LFRSGPTRLRRRRMLLLIAAVLTLYLFIKSIPPDIQSSQSSFPRSRHSVSDIDSAPPYAPPHHPNTSPQQSSCQTNEATEYYYNGPIKFHKLASSLHNIAGTMGHRMLNHNVLFAAASLKSASLL